MGEHDLSQSDEAASIDFDIIERILHPSYRRLYNDIMLFKLDRFVQFNGAIRPACLPERFAISDESAVATGWGTILSGTRSNVLLKATLNFFSQKECSEAYQGNVFLNEGIVEDVHLCAGSRVDDKDTCRGDSGGPIQTYDGDGGGCIYTVVGVTSFGLAQCGTKGFPGVYARVYTYLNWIEQNVWPNE